MPSLPNRTSLVPRLPNLVPHTSESPSSLYTSTASSSSSLQVDQLITPPITSPTRISDPQHPSNSKMTSTSPHLTHYPLPAYLPDSFTGLESKALAGEQDSKVKLRIMGLKRAATWTAEVGRLGGMNEARQGDEGQGEVAKRYEGGDGAEVCDNAESTQGFKPQRPTLCRRSRSQVCPTFNPTIISDATRQDPPSPNHGASHPYRMGPLRPTLSRSWSANSTRAERATSGPGGKRRARPSSAEAPARWGNEGSRPIRAGSWAMGRLGSSALETGASKPLPPKALDVHVSPRPQPAAQIVEPRKPGHSRSTSLDSQTTPVHEGIDMEKLWQEGRCSGRGGKVKCGADEAEYWIEMEGLVASPYSTSLYLCGGRCLKINAEQAVGSDEFHETVDFPESAQMEKMHAKWLPHGKLVVLVPRKSEDDEPESTSSPTRPSPSQQHPLLAVPGRPGLLGESPPRVASGGDVPQFGSRRRGTVRLEDIDAE